MWEIIAGAVWISFGGYVAWYITAAKDYVQINREELLFLWQVHKDRTGCKAKTWKGLSRRNKIVGFQCECGYKHMQKRPITLRSISHSELKPQRS